MLFCLPEEFSVLLKEVMGVSLRRSKLPQGMKIGDERDKSREKGMRGWRRNIIRS